MENIECITYYITNQARSLMELLLVHRIANRKENQIVLFPLSTSTLHIEEVGQMRSHGKISMTATTNRVPYLVVRLAMVRPYSSRGSRSRKEECA